MANFNQFHFKCTNGRAAFLRQIAMIINKSFAKSSKSLDKEINTIETLDVPTGFGQEFNQKSLNSRNLWRLFFYVISKISFQFDDFFFSFFQTCWDTFLRLHTSISSFDRFQIFCCCWQFSGLSPWRLDQLKDYWDKGHHKPSLPLCLCRCCRMSTLSPKGVHGLPLSTHISVCN